MLSDLRALQAVNGTVLYAAGDADVIVKSADGGETWTALSSLTLGMRMLSLHFLDADTGWVGGAASVGGEDGHPLLPPPRRLHVGVGSGLGLG